MTKEEAEDLAKRIKGTVGQDTTTGEFHVATSLSLKEIEQTLGQKGIEINGKTYSRSDI